MRPFVTAKIDDMYDHIKPTQRNFPLNVYISHVATRLINRRNTRKDVQENDYFF